MGTRADFYAGSEWLGSLAFDGYRIHEMEEKHASKSEDNACCWRVKTATTEAEFRQAVADLLKINDDTTTVEQGWPWPWVNSRKTDRAYIFDGSKTVAYAWGNEIVPGDDEAEGPEPKDGWPDMSSRQNVVIGTKRDGVIVIGG